MKNLVKTYLPLFSGFYGTIWENEIDSQIDNFLSENKFATFDDLEIDYDSYKEQICKGVCNFIERELKDFVNSITFEELVSPKYYNFSNDSINCLIDPNYENISKYLIENKSEFEIYLNKNYTSYDGFFSSYSNSYEDWFEETGGFLDFTINKHYHYLGSILNFICKNEGIKEINSLDWIGACLDIKCDIVSFDNLEFGFEKKDALLYIVKGGYIDFDFGYMNVLYNLSQGHPLLSVEENLVESYPNELISFVKNNKIKVLKSEVGL